MRNTRKQNKNKRALTTQELAHAQGEWIKNRQQVSYHKEISSMLSKSTPRKPLVRQLLLFLDDTGVIRFGKRVLNAQVSKSTKFLLRRHQCHACLCEFHTESRTSDILDSCWTLACQESDQSRRHLQDDYRIAVQHPDPSLLPKKRLTQEEPFTVSDVDFTRALYIREAVAEIEITSTSLLACVQTSPISFVARGAWTSA